MALNIFTRFAPRANAANAAYPYGSIKNESVPGAKDGTPLDADWGNDMVGFDAALLAAAGITPSNTPDTAVASQRLQALKALFVEKVELAAQGSDVLVGGVSAGDIAKLWHGANTSGYVYFDAITDGITDNTAAYDAKRAAEPNGATIVLPAGVIKGNFKVENNQRLKGAGRFNTSLIPADNSKPVVLLSDADGGSFADTLFLAASGFSILGNNTAGIGLQVGVGPSPNTATYAILYDIYIFECIDNVVLGDVVGLYMSNVYSYFAVNDGLRIDENNIATLIEAARCNFNQNKTGLNLLGGAIISFRDCGIESNKDVGVKIIRVTSSGARQLKFDSCWLEDNGGTPSTGANSSLFIDINEAAIDDGSIGVQFNNCVISSPDGVKDVFLNRGDLVDFNYCTFTEISPDRLHFNAGNARAFATLNNCGTINAKPSPAMYAGAPDLNESVAGKIQGFTYTYTHDGLLYTNSLAKGFKSYLPVDGDVVNTTGNGAVFTTADLRIVSSMFNNYNYGGEFSDSTGIFTPTVKGIYELSVRWPLTNLSAAMTHAEVYFIVNPGGSQTVYTAGRLTIKSAVAADVFSAEGSARIRLGTGDVVVAAVAVFGGAGNTASISRAASGDFGLFIFSANRL